MNFNKNNMRKTLTEWFKDPQISPLLAIIWKKEIIKQGNSLRGDYNSLAQAINSTLSWSGTTQGSTFWSMLCKHAEDKSGKLRYQDFKQHDYSRSRRKELVNG